MRFAAACTIVTVALVCAAPAPAQETLGRCAPLFRTLQPGETHTYNLQVPAGVQAVLQTSAVSMALGARRMVLTGPGPQPLECSPACTVSTGIIKFTGRAGIFTLRVSQNSGNTGGDYVVTLNIVSQGSANCGVPVRCGATRDGTGFRLPGEVDSFRFDLVAGSRTVVKANYLERDVPGQPRLWIFDPSGREVAPSVCALPMPFEPASSGTYTALAFSCGVVVQRDYRIEVTQAAPICPVGPTITHFGLADSAGNPLAPIGYDAQGRPIYNQMFGQGQSLVVEARAGRSGRNPGVSTVPEGDQDGYLQTIFSRDLGDGHPRVCDNDPTDPPLGGVPATEPFTFDDQQATRDHIHDMGCRFIDGRGQPAGRMAIDACTTTDDGDFDFVDRGSNLQYCAQIAGAWAFADGDTTVRARAKDTDGNFGESREIVVRIGAAIPITSTPTPTPTPRPPTPTRTWTPEPTSTQPFTLVPTRTETRTRTVTRTRTITPTPGTPTATATGPTPTITATATPNDCPGDCDGSRAVQISELTRMVNIALGRTPLSECYAGDADGDGAMNVNDLVSAVGSALGGCTSPA
jgi:hypothetical protein